MRTVLKGRNVKKTYSLIENATVKDDKRIYNARPTIDVKEKLIGYGDICSYEGEPHYNSKRSIWSCSYCSQMNISDKEQVTVQEEIFRADLNEFHLITDKILNEENIYKEVIEELLAIRLKEFNKQMIESDEKLLTYCKLHKLNVEETDVDELFKLVYPNDTYGIENGKLVVADKKIYLSNSGVSIYPNWSFTYADQICKAEACVGSDISTLVEGKISTVDTAIIG